ncbi:MAG: hypothetical protein K8R68_11380 [Bacteroidales bacterium]|nr:hypothetical protein [Bacteroidales bacterium]
MYRLIFLSALLFFFSCNNDVIEEEDIVIEEKTNNNSGGWYEYEMNRHRSMAFKAIDTGDEELYNKAYSWFWKSTRPEYFTFFSKAMALKHNYAKAYYDTYVLYSVFYDIIDENDNTFINYLLFNLAKAHELGYNLPNKLDIRNTTIEKEDIKSSDYYLKRTFP